MKLDAMSSSIQNWAPPPLRGRLVGGPDPEETPSPTLPARGREIHCQLELTAPIQVPQLRPKSGGELGSPAWLAYCRANQVEPWPSLEAAEKSPHRQTGSAAVPHRVGRYEDSPAFRRTPAPVNCLCPLCRTM